MHELITWGKENALEYQGCQTRDEFIKNYKDTLSVISHVASAGGAGASVDKLFSVIGKTTDYTLKHSDLLELEETEIVHIYRSNKIVPDFNSLFEGGFYQEEDCFNNKDDNCDGFLDLADPDCEGADCEFEKYICTPNNEKASIDNCGKIYDKTSCDPGNCIDAECIICEYDKNICLDHEMLAKIDTCGNVYSENFAYCGNGTVCTDGDCIDDGCDYSHTICTDFSTIASVDTCGNIYDKNNCSNGCEDGACTGGGCTYTSTICIDSNTKASKDSCGNTYNQVDCSDKCVDGSCVTGPDCDPLVGTCLDKYTTGWKDQCGNTGQTGTCTGGKVCEGNGNCVDAPTDSCDPLPTGWFMCGCPEKHGVNCHEAGWSCD
jgi:hypothetical protein